LVTAACTVNCTLPAVMHKHEPYEVFLIERRITSQVIETHGGAIIKWVSRKTHPDYSSDHTWMVRCNEVTLTALTLVCKSVTIVG